MDIKGERIQEKTRLTQERLELDTLGTAIERGLAGALWGLVLFGSVARGEGNELSDIDLLAVAEGLPEKFTARTAFVRSLVPEDMRGKVSILAKNREEFERGFPSYYLDIGLDGIILYDRDGYMKQKMKRIQNLIEYGGLVRVRTDGGFCWKWDKPPDDHWRIDWSGVYGL